MRVLIPQICVASGLLEIFQKMQLRGRRNGRKHRVVGSSHRKRKKEEAAGDDASSSSSSNDDDTRDLGPNPTWPVPTGYTVVGRVEL
ncbi:unnamed protein product [Sphagnum jensenii]|uniref:Uncharacterized protein n=1 Tax=Sphagnum jensenii TaxID=128206 RepID=A0ABP0W9B3_9BRYO